MRKQAIFLTSAAAICVAAPATAQTAAADDANKATQQSTSTGDAAGNTAAQPPGAAPAPDATAGTAPGAVTETDQSGNVIVVTGVRASVRSAIQIKRRADQVVDSIVAEDIGKFPDNTVSDSLQRVTGVQVSRGGGEAQTPLIRGLPNIQSYINGREVYTGVLRGVALQDIPAELVAGIDVYKTATPQLVEGGVAGLIDIRMRRPLDFPVGLTLAGGLRAIYSDQAHKWSYVGSGLVSDSWDVGDDGRFGVLIGASYNKRRYLDETAFNFTYTPRFNNTSGPGRGTFYTNPATGHLLLFPQTAGVIYNVGDRTRPALNASVQYSPHSGLEFWVDGLFTGYRERNDYNYFVALPGQAEAPLASYTVAPGTDVVQTVNNLFNFTINSNQAFKRRTDTYQGAAGVKARVGTFDLSSQIVYNNSKVTTRNVIVDVGYVVPSFTYNLNRDGTPFFNTNGTSITNPPFPSVFNLFDNLIVARSHGWAWHGDASHDLGSGFLRTLKFGARVTTRKGDSAATNPSGYGIPFVSVTDSRFPSNFFQTLSPGDAVRGAAGIDQFAVANSSFLLNNTDVLRGLAGRPNGEPPFDPNQTFMLNEKTYAGYAQVNFDTGGSMPVDGVFGARLVNTRTNLSAFSNFNGIVTPINRSENYTDLLPSLSLRFHPTDDVQFRLVLGKSITRPEFGQLNPATATTQAGPTLVGTGSGGNADLQPIRSTNVDATAEYYFSRTGALTVAAFYRKLNGYVQNFTAPEQLPGINGVLSQFQVTRPRNTNGSLRGFDVALTQFADFLPGALSGFGIQANFTYTSGRAFNPIELRQSPITGLSKTSYNIVGIYEKYGLSVRLAYNWRSKFIDSYHTTDVNTAQLGDRITVHPLHFLDLSANYTIGRNITLTFDATNLTRSGYRDDFLPGIAPRDTRSYERTFAGGIRFKY